MSFKKEALRGVLAGSLVLAGCKALPRPTQGVSPAVDFSYASLALEDLLLDNLLPQRPLGQNEYQGLGSRIISLIETQHGIDINSPLEVLEEGRRRVPNLPWSDSELGALRGSLPLLPPYFLQEEIKPREIILIKMPPELVSEPHYGGLYNEGVVSITIAADLDIYSRPEVFGEIFDSGAEIIEYLAAHEWTHGFTDKHPEVLESWIEATGWERQGGKGRWLNVRKDEISPLGGGDVSPAEDIANSVAWMVVKPEFVTQERINFFLESPYFRNWPALEPFRNPPTDQQDTSTSEGNGISLRTIQGEEGRLAAALQERYGIWIDSPLTWLEKDEQRTNLLWSLEEMQFLEGALALLPPQYLTSEVKPQDLVLIKMEGLESANYLNGYANRLLWINLPVENSPDGRLFTVPLGAYFPDRKTYIEFSLSHEWSHAFVESRGQEFIDQWAEATGWYKNPAGQWINGRRFETFPYGRGQDDPNEDFANSVALLVTNPGFLTSERIRFLAESEYFKDWPALQILVEATQSQ